MAGRDVSKNIFCSGWLWAGRPKNIFTYIPPHNIFISFKIYDDWSSKTMGFFNKKL